MATYKGHNYVVIKYINSFQKVFQLFSISGGSQDVFQCMSIKMTTNEALLPVCRCVRHGVIYDHNWYTTQIKKKDELLNAHLSTLAFVKTKKPHRVMKALGKSFQLRPIPLLQLNSFGYSIKKSARGSKSGIAEKVRSESKSKLTCQLQYYAVTKRKELGKWDCAQMKAL